MGVAAGIASAVVRSRHIKSLLFRERRTLWQTVQLVLILGIPFAIGVWIRGSVKSFVAADVSFESVIIMGIMGGRVAGILGAVVCCFSAFFCHSLLVFGIDGR